MAIRKRRDDEGLSVQPQWLANSSSASDPPDPQWAAETLALLLKLPSKTEKESWRHSVIERLVWEVSKKGTRRPFGGFRYSIEKENEVRKHLAALVSVLKEQNRIAALLNWYDDPAKDRAGWKAFDAAQAKVETLLKRYKTSTEPKIVSSQPTATRISGNNWRTPIGKLEVHPLGGWRVRPLFPEYGVRPFYMVHIPAVGKIPSQERRALDLVQILVNRGGLDSLRQCTPCQKWFVARRSDQRHCGLKCRQRTYHASPHYKKQRKENYQRKKQLAGLKENRASRRAS